MAATATSTSPVDLAALGRRMKAGRILAGFDRMTDFASAIEDTLGVSISARSLYAIERGEQMPSLEQITCVIAVLGESWDLINEVLRSDVKAAIQTGTPVASLGED